MERNFLSEVAMQKLPGEEMFRILAKASNPNVVSLTLGEPDFQPPEIVLNYIRIISSSGYSSPSGHPKLKDAICKKLEKENKIYAEPDNIVVTCGATEGLFLASLATVNSHDEIILPDPCFLIMSPIVKMFGGKPVSLELKEEEKFEINPDDIEKLITDKTKILYLNSPSNPTGSALNKKILEEIADIAVENDMLIFSDEAYEDLAYDEDHCSIASLNGLSDRVVSFYTFSKTWAIPGFRLGYLSAPKNIAKAITKLHIYTTVCAPTISQILGNWILENSFKLKYYATLMKNEYMARRNFIVKRLNEIGLNTTKPKGAFYAFSNISQFSKSSIDFADALLDKAKVAVLPGSEFGKFGEGYIRCSYSANMEKISEAMNRIEKALKVLIL